MRVHPRQSWQLALSGFFVVALWTVFVPSATGDTVVAPNQMATANPVLGSGVLRAANYHEQMVYSAAHFPQDIALIITELRFRPDSSAGQAFTTTLASIQFNLSTTTRNPDALSTTYANNVGFDDTVVFSGALNISSEFIGPPGGSKNFDIIIPLSVPFLYNPAAGNLLLEVRNFSGSSTASALGGGAIPGDAASRLGGGLASPTGGADSAVEALQVVYTPTNQPPVPPQPLVLLRGPYLQNGSTTNITIRWRTSLRTNSVVRFGLTEGVLTSGVTNAERTNEHVVTLTGLAPDTRYFYASGASETNLSGGPDCFFFTAPAVQKPTRVWIIGDSGGANQPLVFAQQNPVAVRDAYYAESVDRYTDVWLMLGDNAYGAFGGPPDGSDESYATNVFGLYSSLLRRTVLWSTIGNHDAVNTATYLNIFSFPQNGEAGGVPSGSELYYSFNYGNIHFVCLDSEVSSNAPSGAMLTWLQQDLADNTNEWLIVYWHSPPYSYGSHNSDDILDSGGKLVQMRENVVPILENYGVDLVLGGHSHNYERSFLIDGHYGYANSFHPTMAKDAGSGRENDSGAYLKEGSGPAVHEGAIYAVVGSSTWATPGHPGIPFGKYLKHPAMFIGLQKLGSMVLDVSSNRLDAKFLRENGAIDDYFTILKGAGPEPLRIKTLNVNEDTITMQFKTIAGQRYQILHATDVASVNWQPIGAPITATGVTTKWIDTAPDSGSHFYRIVILPPAP
jgi:hypothetical protein